MADAITGTIARAATALIFTYYYCIMIILYALFEPSLLRSMCARSASRFWIGFPA